MKTHILLFTALFLAIFSFGQKKKPQNNSGYDNKLLHLGFTLGMNQMGFNLKPDASLIIPYDGDIVYGVDVKPLIGFNLGILADLRLNNTFNLRMQPGMLFGQRNLVYTIRDKTAETSDTVLVESLMQIPSIHLDLPLLIKMRAERINNYRPYIVAGMSVKYDLESRKKTEDGKEYQIKTYPLDYYCELGFGIDYYLPYFKLSTELKYCIGLKDILVHEPIIEKNRVIDELKSKIIILSFHFE